MWDEIIHTFNGVSVDVWEWINNFTSHTIPGMWLLIYAGTKSKIMLVKGVIGMKKLPSQFTLCMDMRHDGYLFLPISFMSTNHYI